MTEPKSAAAAKPMPRLSLDTWAVVIALAAAALIRLGLITRVPW